MTKYVLTFIPQSGAYHAHQHGCGAAITQEPKKRLIDKVFATMTEARKFADKDESAKAGIPIAARFVSCGCIRYRNRDE